jgi:general L-amino acid transport system permease protein
LGTDVFLNNRGLYFPLPQAWEEPGLGLLVAILALGLAWWTHHRKEWRSRLRHVIIAGLCFAAVVAFVYAYMVATKSLDRPRMVGLNFRGGGFLTPELMALFVALSLYASSFIAEIVRGGVISVDTGQYEAATSLGLSRWNAIRLIVLPQALRIIVPPLTNQYVNITKLSSLAAAIAYPDLMQVFGKTTLNQTGQAVEVITLTMAVYLAISLGTSGAMRLFNARVALKGGAR